MKRNNILMAMAITFLVVILFSWVIPTGSYGNGEFTGGSIAPIGFMDFILYPLQTFSYFSQYGVLFLVIGGTYGVLNKTGVYSKVVNGLVKTFNGKRDRELFLIITTFVMALLSALTNLQLLLFVLVPFLASIIILLGYKKITAMLATVGAILVGGTASIISYDTNYIFTYFNVESGTNMIIGKIILFILLAGALVGFVWLKAEREEKEEKEPIVSKAKRGKKEEVKETKAEEKPKTVLFDNYEENKSALPLVITMVIVLIIAFLGMFKWYQVFGWDFFSTSYTSIIQFKILNYAVFNNILGKLTAFGSWDTNELSMLLILGSLLIGWLYSIKFKEIIKSFVDGAKEMLPTAFYVVLANFVIVILYMSTTGDSQFFTVINKIIGTASDINVGSIFQLVGTSGFGSLYINNLMHLFGNSYAMINSHFASTQFYGLIALIYQIVYGIVMMILPTSIVLVAGLSYFEVSYREWLKKIWQYLLVIFAVSLVTIIIIFMFIK